MKITSIILLALLPLFVFPQGKRVFENKKMKSNNTLKDFGTLKGKVLDKDTKEPLAFAAVLLEAKKKSYGVNSDENGNYELNEIPIGKYELKTSYMGYNPFNMKDVLIVKDSIKFLNIEMKSLNIKLKEKEIEKPAIYLYPKIAQEIKVTLDFKGKVVNTYPKYDKGWTVRAEPDGKLFNPADKRNYNYLFWDGIYTHPREHYDYKTGFIVKRNDIVDFLQSKLSFLGLNETEINDFIVYWLPQLNKNETNLIHFWINDNIDNSAFLDIEPKPDTEIRVFMEFRKADNKQTIPVQKLIRTERKGFTVVEWGGSDISGNRIE